MTSSLLTATIAPPVMAGSARKSMAPTSSSGVIVMDPTMATASNCLIINMVYRWSRLQPTKKGPHSLFCPIGILCRPCLQGCREQFKLSWGSCRCFCVTQRLLLPGMW